MSFFDALQSSSAGLSAQRLRMKLISSNLANINTTRTPQGGPYRRKDAVFGAASSSRSFRSHLDAYTNGSPDDVKVLGIVEDRSQPIRKLDPSLPDADAKGYVALPNINVMEEMVNMISATRSYEANVAAIRATKAMALKALEIGR